MGFNADKAVGSLDRSTRYRDESLTDQLRWFVDLRWLAITGIVLAVTVGKYGLGVLDEVLAVYGCAAVLLLCNLIYLLRCSGDQALPHPRAVVLGMAQVELDLLILTAVLYFSGGLSNPFTPFFLFHVIAAAILLPSRHSLVVALTSVGLYGLLAANTLAGGWPGYHPLKLSPTPGLWSEPLYVYGAVLAFASTVFLARYLTRIVMVRMTAKEAEAARNHDVLKAVIQAMNEGLVFLDREHRVVFSNPAARAWLSATHGPGEPSLEAYPPALGTLVHRLADTPGASAKAEMITTHTAPRSIELQGSTVMGLRGGELGHVVVGRDLTEHKRLERELTEQTEQVAAINEALKMSRVQMAQREKMVAVGQMAAGIAHEIGNPLASLSCVAQYLVRRSPSAEAKEQMGVMQTHITRISDILKRMLNFTRPATAEFRWADLNALIENTLSLVQFDERMRGVTVKHETTGDLPTVWLNPQSLEQILLNVVINALDAMEANAPGRERILTLARRQDGAAVEIEIRDTGIGMPQAVADRAFESFFTTKEIGRGTGLGLFICHNLVTELDGTIRLTSTPGAGTSVRIRLPLHPQTAMFSTSPAEDTQP